MARTSVHDRILRLLSAPPAEPDLSAGYLDLLGPGAAPAPTVAQRVMRSTFLPQIYERLWRPVGFNLAKGWPFGPGTAAEQALARDWLGLGRPGDARRPAATVLDVACGPGNVTRALAAGVAGDGLVVGLDAAPAMLDRAVADTADTAGATGGGAIGYVRGDAVELPFGDATFDAVCCFGALYLFDEPWTALESMLRVLRPGGRIVILTSRRPVLPVGRLGAEAFGRVAGLTVFGDREVTGFLREHGLTDVRQRRFPLMQLAGARRP
ncbi:class I SAM-dependent methyltransferase [Actinomadura kijaniata]|uniref:class I SAM-dependent methyltransferase n=1 Tax=Actinomadura kijaniata TaxID=46161 RepID=UPI00082C72A5|nr:methyltransferase domain-containing protein [Actinomadura kijaniata]